MCCTHVYIVHVPLHTSIFTADSCSTNNCHISLEVLVNTVNTVPMHFFSSKVYVCKFVWIQGLRELSGILEDNIIEVHRIYKGLFFCCPLSILPGQGMT